MTAQLGGAIVPLVTPFAKSGEVERKAISPLVDFFVREGADALMPTALTGEGPLLGEDETLLVWEEVFAAVAGRRPVYPAISKKWGQAPLFALFLQKWCLSPLFRKRLKSSLEAARGLMGDCP